MMKKTAVAVVMITVMLLFAKSTKAGVSVMVNGSFEYDGEIVDINSEPPQAWSDVNFPEEKFGGKVNDGWSSDGDYSLFFYVMNVPTNTGDMVRISQQVYLADVNEISFDIKLSSPVSFYPWEFGRRAALVMIDGVVVWDSNGLGPSVNGDGEYLYEWIDVEGMYDASPHILTLAMKINEDIANPFVPYYAQWDNVRFDSYCRGRGYLYADINYDCYVDVNDLKDLVAHWLEEPPTDRYDLFPDSENIIDLRDFAVLADSWMDSSYELADELLVMDLNNDGIVNFPDFAILAKDWDLDYDDVFILAEQWLDTNWLYGL
ncbi:MAG: hypothetical protein ACYS1A_15185 [Planctomycetota bacterium]|jgi:hypothetical protein